MINITKSKVLNYVEKALSEQTTLYYGCQTPKWIHQKTDAAAESTEGGKVMTAKLKNIGLWAAAIFFSTVIICTFFVAVGFMVLQVKEWCL